jgi:hypothetical protein
VSPQGDIQRGISAAGAITSAAAIADTRSMGNSSYMQRSYRIGPDGSSVLCDTIADRPDVDALLDAIAWRRGALSRTEMQDVDSVLELRTLMVLEDMLESTCDYEEHVPLTFRREQVCMLGDIAGAYVSERDVESYQSPEERDRIERLRSFGGPFLDCCSEFAAAQDEARERELLV